MVHPLYSPILMDHFTHPRNAGAMADATCVGRARYPVCGDAVAVYLRIEGRTITRASFLASGCGPGIACASAATVLVAGRSVADAEALSVEHVVEAVGGIPRQKRHAAELVVAALQAALAEHRLRSQGARGGDVDAPRA